MACPIIIFHMFVVNRGALLGFGFRFRIFSVGASVALLSIAVSKQFRSHRIFRNLQSQSSKGIHNKIDPEKLNSVQNTVTRPVGDGRHES